MKRLSARFYRTTSGNEPVREWLRALAPADRRLVGIDIATVEYGWPVGMPTCRPLGGGLHEVRTPLPSGRTVRVLFCVHAGHVVLLHAFMKKTRKTPPADLRIARQRQQTLAP